MSDNPTYKFSLVDANEMTELDGLESTLSREFKPVFNGPGSYDVSVPLGSDAAYLARKHETGVIIFRNEIPIWSGETMGVRRNGKAGTCDLSFIGWEDQLNRRFVRRDEEASLIFASPGSTGGTIAAALINKVNLQQDTDGVVRPLRLGFGSASDTQARIRAYKQGDNYGRLFDELHTVENGFDHRIDPLSKRIFIRDPEDFDDLTGLQFGYYTDPNNLDDCVENDDGSSTANRINVVGPNGVLYVADDGAAMDQIGGMMYESWNSISDASGGSSTVLAYANGELVFKRFGNKTYTLTPKTLGDVPRPYDDFQWGDQGYLSASKDSLQVDKQPIRLFSATISIDGSGSEIISNLQVAFS